MLENIAKLEALLTDYLEYDRQGGTTFAQFMQTTINLFKEVQKQTYPTKQELKKMNLYEGSD